MTKPIFDSNESLEEVIQWVAEPLDIMERSQRLAEACAESDAFHVFIDQTFNPTMSFSEALDSGALDVRPKKLGRWGYVPYTKLIQEIGRYTNDSKLLPRYRLNQLIGALDDTFPPDGEHLIKMVRGENSLPDKINQKVYQLAFPHVQLGEAGGRPL